MSSKAKRFRKFVEDQGPALSETERFSGFLKLLKMRLKFLELEPPEVSALVLHFFSFLKDEMGYTPEI